MPCPPAPCEELGRELPKDSTEPVDEPVVLRRGGCPRGGAMCLPRFDGEEGARAEAGCNKRASDGVIVAAAPLTRPPLEEVTGNAGAGVG